MQDLRFRQSETGTEQHHIPEDCHIHE